MSFRPPHRKSDVSSEPSRPIARYNVVLHRTTDQGLLFVARVLRELTRFGEAEAMARMWETYHRGRALILITHLERAELYVEQFADRGLIASIEPA
jgi:ATP-dependent Clp protease adapter protein ClpS